MAKKQQTQGVILNHYKIGQIVSLRSNALQSIPEYSIVSLAGDPDFITPLMVVVEVLDTKTHNIDEVTGEERFNKGQFQYKCMWFSKNNFRFETNWFHGKELLHYTEEVADTSDAKDKTEEGTKKEPVKFEIGDKLVFKTNSIEITKERLSFSSKNGQSSVSTNPVLTFSSPAFVFVGYAKVDKKESERDLKSLEQKRWYPQKMVKVKSFNKKDDKISELLVPIEVMEKVAEVDDRTKGLLIAAVQNNNTPNTPKQAFGVTIKEKERFVTPEQIISLPNLLRVGVKDVFTREESLIDASSLKLEKTDFITIKEQFKKQYPDFKKKSVVTVNNFIQKHKLSTFKDKCFRIVYKNKFDKITVRYIIPNTRYSISMKEDGKEWNEYYLNAFCLLRMAERNFKVKRIISLEEVEGKVLDIAKEYRGKTSSTNSKNEKSNVY